MKAFAGRPQDWVDLTGIAMRQGPLRHLRTASTAVATRAGERPVKPAPA